MAEQIPKGDSDLVAEVMANCIKQIASLIEGKFLDKFEVSFELENQEYILKLEKVNP